MSPIIGYPCHSLNDLACEDANSKLLNPVPDVNAINALTTVWCIWKMKIGHKVDIVKLGLVKICKLVI